MSTNSDARDIIESVQTLAGPTEIDPARHYVVPVAGDGQILQIAPDEQRAATPFRPRGTTTAYDVDALQGLWQKYAADWSDLFGDPVAHKFTAVFNADGGAGADAGFRDLRAELPLRKTTAWQKWQAIDGQLLEQTAFAEFLEARIIDVVRPTGAEMLELATTLEASSSVEFKSAINLGSGVRQFQFEETQTARAGQTGQLEVPKDIELGIAPFEGGDTFRVTARFRHRIRGGNLSIGVVLDRPEDVEKAAFDSYAQAVSQACDKTVLLGTPPQPTLQVR